MITQEICLGGVSHSHTLKGETPSHACVELILFVDAIEVYIGDILYWFQAQ